MATDAVSFLKTKTRKGWAFALFVVLAFESTFSALTSRYGKGGWWLGDFDAVVCGAWRIGQGQSPYVLPSACQGLEAAAFVYAPQIASAFAPVVDLLGPWGLHWAYMPLLVASIGVLIWYAVFKPIPNAPLHMRLMGLMAIRGSPITTGNFGAVLQAAIIMAVGHLQRWRWLFVAVVIIAALVKPTFLTVLVVLLFEDRAWRHRLLAFGTALGLGLIAVLILIATTGHLRDDWKALISQVVLERQPGRGVFMGLSSLGIHEDTLPAYMIYAVYSALAVGAGMAIVTWNKLEDDERAALGLSVAQLINPRLFEYNFDFYLLYPGIIVIVMLSQRLNPGAFVWLSWLFVGGMAAEFFINMVGISALRPIPRSFLICSAILFSVAALSLRDRRDQVRDWLRRPDLAVRSFIRMVANERP